VITQGNGDARHSHGVTGEVWCGAFCHSLRQLRAAGGESDAQGGAEIVWLVSFNLLEKLQLAHSQSVRGRAISASKTQNHASSKETQLRGRRRA